MSIVENKLIYAATYVCCPWCDERQCVGTNKCREVQQWIKKKREELRSEEE